MAFLNHDDAAQPLFFDGGAFQVLAAQNGAPASLAEQSQTLPCFHGRDAPNRVKISLVAMAGYDS
jgi:hypothetical protein